MHRNLLIANLMFFMVLGFTQTAFGFEESKATIFGAKIGVLLPGEYAIGDADIETDAGFHGGIFLDQQLAPKLYGGVFADISSASASEADATGTRLDIGFTLKGHFPHQASHLTFRPGVGFGYGYADTDVTEEGANLFTVNVFLEVLYSLQEKIALIGEIGFTSAPAGGTADVDVTNSPIFMIRTGVAF